MAISDSLGKIVGTIASKPSNGRFDIRKPAQQLGIPLTRGGLFSLNFLQMLKHKIVNRFGHFIQLA